MATTNKRKRSRAGVRSAKGNRHHHHTFDPEFPAGSAVRRLSDGESGVVVVDPVNSPGGNPVVWFRRLLRTEAVPRSDLTPARHRRLGDFAVLIAGTDDGKFAVTATELDTPGNEVLALAVVKTESDARSLGVKLAEGLTLQGSPLAFVLDRNGDTVAEYGAGAKLNGAKVARGDTEVKVVSRKLRKQTTRGATSRWYELLVSVSDKSAPLGRRFYNVTSDADMNNVTLPDDLTDGSVRQGILSAVHEYQRRAR